MVGAEADAKSVRWRQAHCVAGAALQAVPTNACLLASQEHANALPGFHRLQLWPENTRITGVG